MHELVCLRLFSREGLHHRGHLIHDFLIAEARELGASGATVLRASAGFGRHGLHEDSFFELGGELPVVVEIVLSTALADTLLARCADEDLHLFYTRTPVTAGVTGQKT